MLNVVSLGAGVQSSTLVLLAAGGVLEPKPDVAIFADTGAEPGPVYRHLAWLETALPFPVHHVSAGNLFVEIMRATTGESRRWSNARPPFFVKSADGEKGMIRRQCTGDFKIDPIQRRIRELVGLSPGERWPPGVHVSQWIGISIDEASRIKPSRLPAIVHRWPLIELGWTRSACLAWLEAHGYPEPPKSACTFCPYRSDQSWRALRDTDPAGWQQAITLDRAIRTGIQGPTLRGELFLHGSLVPLEEADISSPAERGQPNLFENECDGMCGV
jgi:hypothetical protein